MNLTDDPRTQSALPLVPQRRSGSRVAKADCMSSLTNANASWNPG